MINPAVVLRYSKAIGRVCQGRWAHGDNGELRLTNLASPPSSPETNSHREYNAAPSESIDAAMQSETGSSLAPMLFSDYDAQQGLRVSKLFPVDAVGPRLAKLMNLPG